MYDSRCLILSLDYSNQSEWGMSAYFNGQLLEHNVLSIHFESFNKEFVTIQEA